MPSIKQVKRSFRVEIKAINEDGSFDGLLAVYNNVDLGKDLIEPGAFTKTIQEHGSTVPLLWQHDTEEPIGSLTLIDSPDALRVKGQLLLDLPVAQKAYLLLKAHIIKGLSIGYDTIKESVDGKIRRLKELRLWEGSVVTFPMNEAAMVTAIKAIKERKDTFDAELTELQLMDAGSQLFCALFNSLGFLTWADGISIDDKVTAAGVTIDQFKDAFLAYLPLYLAYLTEQYGDMELMSQERRQEHALALVTKSLQAFMESKAGREFSAANMTTLKAAHDHVKQLKDIFDTLLPEGADDDPDDEDDKAADTPEAKAAPIIPEPENTHSAEKILDEIIKLIPPKD